VRDQAGRNRVYPDGRQFQREPARHGFERRVHGTLQDRARRRTDAPEAGDEAHRAGHGPKVGHGGVERFLPAAENEDEGALLDEALCRSAADAGSATRDDRNLTLKLSLSRRRARTAGGKCCDVSASRPRPTDKAA
jgi:hypothetical protein